MQYVCAEIYVQLVLIRVKNTYLLRGKGKGTPW